MKKRSSPKEYFIFLSIAVIFVVIADQWLVPRDYLKPEAWQERDIQNHTQSYSYQAPKEFYEPPEVVMPDSGADFFEAENILPVWRKNAVAFDTYSDKPKIAIVIDDIGMNMKYSRLAGALPAPVTLAFLPYADQTPKLAAQAKDNGHELIIHVPMEAVNSDLNLGPLALRSGMDDEVFDRELDEILDSFEGYVGLNNHMGSRLTQDPQAMKKLMTRLKQEELLFLDSRTIHTSIAAETARDYGVPYAVRDVFLDHEGTPEFVRNALADVERIAKKHGQVIAIGHPKQVTISALQKWIPTLEEKGFQLVPVSAVIKQHPAFGTLAQDAPPSQPRQ